MLHFQLLGPLEVRDGERVLPVRRRKLRAVLAVLALRAGEPVTPDRLVEDVWGETPPRTARHALENYVSELRRTLGHDAIRTEPAGYALSVAPEQVDAMRLEQLLDNDMATRDRADRLRSELAHVRGQPLEDLAFEPFAQTAVPRLLELELTAREELAGLEIELGHHADVVLALEALAREHPYREHLRALLMLALYQSGRQAEALAAYQDARSVLVEDLGIDPSEELQELERAILRQDPELRQPSRSESRPAEPEQPGLRRRRRPLVLAVALAVAALAAGALALALTNGASSSAHDTADLRPFVGKLENFLVQSREGRREVTAAVAAAAHCRLGPGAAVARLDRVQRNRQSLLQQVAALSIPADPAALRASDTFQKAEQASIAADWHYRDWLYARRRCGGTAGRADLLEARAADLRATRLKQEFLSAFNPLARRYGQRTWNAAEF